MTIADNLVNLLNNIQAKGFKLDDNTNEYIIAAWQRLISVMEEDFKK